MATASHLGHLLTADEARPAPDPPPATSGAIADWWAKQILERLSYPLATVPALSELGIVEGPGGVQGFLQTAWAVISRLLEHLPFVQFTPPAAALTEANELEQGVAAAAKRIRKKGLRPGQP